MKRAHLGFIVLGAFSMNDLGQRGAIVQMISHGASVTGLFLIAGALEQSNVNGVRGAMNLIKVSRAYEALLTMIETYREVDSRTSSSLGGPK